MHGHLNLKLILFDFLCYFPDLFIFLWYFASILFTGERNKYRKV